MTFHRLLRTPRHGHGRRRRTHRIIKRVIVIKSVVMVGLIAGYFLPPADALIVSVGANMLWLWKT